MNEDHQAQNAAVTAECPTGCILAIVGSRDLEGDDAAAVIIEEVLDLHKPRKVVSGGAIGIDTMGAAAARARGIEVEEFLPENPVWEPNGFKDRNIRIAYNCECLVRISASTTKTYGSGQCADFAESIGRRVTRVKIPKEDRHVARTSQTQEQSPLEHVLSA